MVRYLLEQGADRDKKDVDGNTPLHDAASYGHLEIAMLLMSYGADLNAKNNDGQLPIDLADDDEMIEAFYDEPRRRMDHGHKRSNAAISSSSSQQYDVNNEEGGEEEEEEEVEQSNKRTRIDEGVIAGEETMVAEEDEGSEPSDAEDYD